MAKGSPAALSLEFNFLSLDVPVIFLLAPLRALLHALMHLPEILTWTLTCGFLFLGSFGNLKLGLRSSEFKYWLGLLWALWPRPFDSTPGASPGRVPGVVTFNIPISWVVTGARWDNDDRSSWPRSEPGSHVNSGRSQNMRSVRDFCSQGYSWKGTFIIIIHIVSDK